MEVLIANKSSFMAAVSGIERPWRIGGSLGYRLPGVRVAIHHFQATFLLLIACAVLQPCGAQTAAIKSTGNAPSGSHPLDTLVPMTWFEVPNSAVSTS